MIKSESRFYKTRYYGMFVGDYPAAKARFYEAFPTGRANEGYQRCTANYPVREPRVYNKRSLGLFPDELELGSAPYAEKECLDDPDYDADIAKIKCRVYKEYLQRLFPIPQEFEGQLCYRIRGRMSSFGTPYYDVSILYNAYNLASSFVPNIERPSQWDQTALDQLRSLTLRSCVSLILR
ncbi:MAG: hypothetical protein V7K47_06770 [Nostoc sp.]